MARIKLLRNKREIQVKQMRKEISQLLTSGQEPSARIRVSTLFFAPFFRASSLEDFLQTRKACAG